MMSLVSLAYATLLLIEGVGLWFEFSWAAYLTVISTSLLLPFELYEVIERITAVRGGGLLPKPVILLSPGFPVEHHSPRSPPPSKEQVPLFFPFPPFCHGL